MAEEPEDKQAPLNINSLSQIKPTQSADQIEINSPSSGLRQPVANSSPVQSSSSPKLKLLLLLEVFVITFLFLLLPFAWKKAVIEPNKTVASVGIEKFVGDVVNIPPNEAVVTSQQDFYNAKPKANEVVVYKNLDNYQQRYDLRWLVENKLVELRIDFSYGRSGGKQLLRIIIDGGPGGTENSNEAIPLSIFKDERIQSTIPETLQPSRSCITTVSYTSCREFTNQPDGLIAISVSGGDESGNFHQVIASFEKPKVPYQVGTGSSKIEYNYFSIGGFFSAFTQNTKISGIPLLPLALLMGIFLPLLIAIFTAYFVSKKLFHSANLLNVNAIFIPLGVVMIIVNYLFVLPIIGTFIEIVFLGGIP